ncbi:1,2-phenylacetyl-CoA epoxidase subunit PaaD [Bacillus benzoevorans]|uniref:Ring-1,2-phenylacetyl-CoA epoxidase subunit PaaD n=1 Tax=Bacillus benzoevorans TaxID=1456 RepID=A0A7X0HN21_9BACI|nr:1,2-phenylacetyl-CoA epoxidase subunit PaaD [Bacillus benzoevorans]MBB6443611.1 ring-1,2-phenylacetyl-CoA epoxidase subunit PaaD [Bacillus benzoevorans]
MHAPTQITEKDILIVLEKVKDPEIDTVSILDLGMVENIMIQDNKVKIEVLPTFIGCPALEIIRGNIMKAVNELEEVEETVVEFIHTPPYTSDRITEKGLQGLKAFGIAPPPEFVSDDGSWHVDCPYCGSTYVTLDNIFGPTACRSILYCKSCKNPFEAMKLISTTI